MESPAVVADLPKVGITVGDGAGEITRTVAQYRIDQAWRGLQRESSTRHIAEWINTGLVSAEDTADVVLAAAARIMRNPEAHTRESSSIDDYSEAFDVADATEDLYFTAAELRRLQPYDAMTPTAGSFKYS